MRRRWLSIRSRSSSDQARSTLSPSRALKRGGSAANTRPEVSIGRMNRQINVNSKQRMWLPSTSASQRITIRPYRDADRLKLSPAPAPIEVKID